jgi:hypothetical protein
MTTIHDATTTPATHADIKAALASGSPPAIGSALSPFLNDLSPIETRDMVIRFAVLAPEAFTIALDIHDSIRVARAQLTRPAWTPRRGDTVERTDQPGIWTITAFEDDTTVHLVPAEPDPADDPETFLAYLATEPTGTVLADVATLRPAQTDGGAR